MPQISILKDSADKPKHKRSYLRILSQTGLISEFNIQKSTKIPNSKESIDSILDEYIKSIIPLDFKDDPEFFVNQMDPNKQNADQINKDPKKFQLDDSFIMLAFLKKQKNKYSYERLKHEMSTVNPEIREVPLEEFKNTLKFAFTKLKSNQNSPSRNSINSLDDYKEITNQMADYLNTDPSTTKNSVLPGIEQMKGIWNNIETQHLIYVLMKKSYQKKFFSENGSINWEKVSHYVPGRSPKCCYDKYKQLLKCKQIEKIENIFSIEDSDVKSINSFKKHSLHNKKQNCLTLFSVG